MSKTTRQYLADVKRRLGISSDYALAKALELTQQGASSLSNGRTVMSNTVAARVAELLEIPAIQVIADCELERGSSPELWKRLRDAAAIAGAVIGAALLYRAAASGFDITGISNALAALAVPLELTVNTHCMIFAGVAVLTAAAALKLLRPGPLTRERAC